MPPSTGRDRRLIHHHGLRRHLFPRGVPRRSSGVAGRASASLMDVGARSSPRIAPYSPNERPPVRSYRPRSDDGRRPARDCPRVLASDGGSAPTLHERTRARGDAGRFFFFLSGWKASPLHSTRPLFCFGGGILPPETRSRHTQIYPCGAISRGAIWPPGRSHPLTLLGTPYFGFRSVEGSASPVRLFSRVTISPFWVFPFTARPPLAMLAYVELGRAPATQAGQCPRSRFDRPRNGGPSTRDMAAALRHVTASRGATTPRRIFAAPGIPTGPFARNFSPLACRTPSAAGCTLQPSNRKPLLRPHRLFGGGPAPAPVPGHPYRRQPREPGRREAMKAGTCSRKPRTRNRRVAFALANGWI